jgi:DNA-binding NtrC family response regulator
MILIVIVFIDSRFTVESIGEDEHMNSPNRTTVLLVERDKDLRRVISASLAQMDVNVLEARDDKEARQILEKDHVKILIVEHDWKHSKNTNVIEAYREQMKGEIGKVLVTTKDRLDDNWREQQNPLTVLYKPFDVRYLCRLIKTYEGKTLRKEPSH